MFRIESGAVDNPKEAPSGLNIWDAGAMETRVVIARLRRLLDVLEAEAERLADEASGLSGAGEARVMAGRSLGMTAAARMLREILTDLVREATRGG